MGITPYCLANISIHASLTGSDRDRGIKAAVLRISIHASLTGSDVTSVTGAADAARFQSTLPLRGATGIHANTCTQQIISIHASLTGSDRYFLVKK